MKQATKYNLANQNSPFAGSTSELSLSTGKSPITNTENSLLSEYQHFHIKWKNLIIHQETFLLNKGTFLLNRESFLLNQKTFLFNRETFLLNKETFLFNRETFLFNRETFLMHQKRNIIHRISFRMNDNLSLLRNKNFRSGSKAFMIVRTLYLKRTSLSQSTGDYACN